jgi:hypothetical protein
MSTAGPYEVQTFGFIGVAIKEAAAPARRGSMGPQVWQ